MVEVVQGKSDSRIDVGGGKLCAGETAVGFVQRLPENFFEAYEISTAVNRTANDTPKLIERFTASASEVVLSQKPHAKREERRRVGRDVLVRLQDFPWV